MQEERRRERAAEAALLAAGAAQYEVEVNGLQIYAVAGAANGRLLLAAARAQLGGRALAATRQAVLTFDMQQARPYSRVGHGVWDCVGCVRGCVRGFRRLSEGACCSQPPTARRGDCATASW